MGVAIRRLSVRDYITSFLFYKQDLPPYHAIMSTTTSKTKMSRPLVLLVLAHLGVCGPLLCEQFAFHLESGYGINNNLWGSQFGSGSQCTYVDSMEVSGIAWHVDWSWQGEPYNVKSYPYSGLEFAEKKLLSDVRSLPMAVDWTYHGDDIRANVAFDLFTAADPERETSHGDYELMVW